ncbi:MAG: MFS transporter [Methermicoccaceae archaeon]
MKYVLWLVCTFIFIEAMGYGAIVPTLPLLAPEASDAQLGLLFSAYALSSLVVLFPLSWVCDHIDRRIVVRVGLASFCLASLGFALSSEFWLLVVFRALQGVGGIAIWTGGLALVLDVLTQERAGRTMSYISAAFGGGAIVGPGLGGLGSPHLPFIILSVLGLLGFVLSVWLPKGVPRVSAGAARPSVIHDQLVLVLLCGVLTVSMVFGMLEAHAPKHLYELGASVQMVAGMFVVLMLFHTLVQLPVGIASDRFGEMKVAVLGLLGGAVLIPTMLVDSLFGKMAALIATGTVLALVFTPSIAAIGKHVPASQRGRVMGLNNLCWSTGYFLGPAGGGIVVERLSFGWALMVASGVLLLVAVLYLLGFRGQALLSKSTEDAA